MSDQEDLFEPRVVAIASGKGGSGRSLVAANLGIFLATLGKRVVVLDASFGSANVHAFLGVAEPKNTLGEMLHSRDAHLSDLVEKTPIPGLELISGARDPWNAANPHSSQLTRLRAQIRKLDTDYVVMDLGGTTSSTTLDFYLLADLGLILLAPDPTAIELGYRFIRSAFLRRLGKSFVQALDLDYAEARGYEGGIPAPLDLYHRTVERGADQATINKLRRTMLGFRPNIVLNFVRSKSDADLGRAISSASTRRLGVAVRYLGHVDYDDAVWVALRRRRPLLVEHPECRASKCIEKLTRRLLSLDGEKEPTELPIGGETHYELLDIEPSASDEDIRRANRRIRELYAHEAVVVSGLYSAERLDDLHLRFDEAYDTLMEPARRKEYDQALFPDGVPSTSHVTHPHISVVDTVPESERPPMPEIAQGADFTGSLLRQVREARGLDLHDIAERTKIGMAYLSAIENETFKKLPATVYVRGFLVEYAKMIRVDVDQVLDTYLKRYRMARVVLDAEE